LNKKNIALMCSVFILLVGCGKKDSSSSTPGPSGIVADCVKLPCFYSVETENGNLGGISGADALCQTKHSTAKAFLVDGVKRSADPQKDWVLDPNTSYYHVDGTLIGTTNEDGLFAFPLSESLLKEEEWYWTGMLYTWESNTDNCLKWTSTTPAESGSGGTGDVTSPGAIWVGKKACGVPNKLLCVAH